MGKRVDSLLDATVVAAWTIPDYQAEADNRSGLGGSDNHTKSGFETEAVQSAAKYIRRFSVAEAGARISAKDIADMAYLLLPILCKTGISPTQAASHACKRVAVKLVEDLPEQTEWDITDEDVQTKINLRTAATPDGSTPYRTTSDDILADAIRSTTWTASGQTLGFGPKRDINGVTLAHILTSPKSDVWLKPRKSGMMDIPTIKDLSILKVCKALGMDKPSGPAQVKVKAAVVDFLAQLRTNGLKTAQGWQQGRYRADWTSEQKALAADQIRTFTRDKGDPGQAATSDNQFNWDKWAVLVSTKVDVAGPDIMGYPLSLGYNPGQIRTRMATPSMREVTAANLAQANQNRQETPGRAIVGITPGTPFGNVLAGDADKAPQKVTPRGKKGGRVGNTGSTVPASF